MAKVHSPNSTTIDIPTQCSSRLALKRTISDASNGLNTENKCTYGSDFVRNQDFDSMCFLGDGSFGRVVLARKKTGHDCNKLYALKYLSIEQNTQKEHLANIIEERRILEKIHGLNYLIQMHYAFCTTKSLVFVTEFAHGGELFSFVTQNANGTDISLVRLWSAQLVSALSALHNMHIIYRDLKLENILIDIDGNILLTDFGMSKILTEPFRTNDYGGTFPYVAPEVYCCSYVSTAWFTFSADLWSLGILMYELAIGKAPFGNNSDGQNRKEAEIIAFKGCLNLTSAGVANKADGCQTFGDLITKLLVWNPMFRIGIEDIKIHPFFDRINWQQLNMKRYQSSWKPMVDDSNVTKYIDSEFTKSALPDCTKERSLVKGEYPEIFKNFQFNASSAYRANTSKNNQIESINKDGHNVQNTSILQDQNNSLNKLFNNIQLQNKSISDSIDRMEYPVYNATFHETIPNVHKVSQGNRKLAKTSTESAVTYATKDNVCVTPTTKTSANISTDQKSSEAVAGSGVVSTGTRIMRSRSARLSAKPEVRYTAYFSKKPSHEVISNVDKGSQGNRKMLKTSTESTVAHATKNDGCLTLTKEPSEDVRADHRASKIVAGSGEISTGARLMRPRNARLSAKAEVKCTDYFVTEATHEAITNVDKGSQGNRKMLKTGTESVVAYATKNDGCVTSTKEPSENVRAVQRSPETAAGSGEVSTGTRIMRPRSARLSAKPEVRYTGYFFHKEEHK